MAVLMENNADPNIQDKEVKIYSYIHKSPHTHTPVCVILVLDTTAVIMAALYLLWVLRGGLLSTGHVTTAIWML